MTSIHELRGRLGEQVAKVVVGQERALELVLIALVCEGHLLLEGVPGVAKTTLARAVAAALGLSFRRVQFTPDLMPSDILGTQVFDFQAGRFHVVEGPVFTHFLLADEINRAPAKTQAALLEAMQERQVSIEGHARPLPAPFLVVATQNPVEHEGTYPLPEAQLDRFLFKITIDYPSADEEVAILAQHAGDTEGQRAALASVVAVVRAEDLTAARADVLKVRVEPVLARYLVDLVRATRADPALALGASPRAAVLLQLAARAAAALEARDFVIPDDIKRLLVPTLRHRVRLTAAAEVEGDTVDQALARIADGVPVPR